MSVDYTRGESGERLAGGYGERHGLRVRRWMDLPYDGCLGFVTLIHPFVGRLPEVHIRPLAAAGTRLFRAEALEVTSAARRDLILLNPELLAGFKWHGEELTARARVHLGMTPVPITVAKECEGRS